MVSPREDDGFVDMSSQGPKGSEGASVNLEAALELHPRGAPQILDFAVEVLIKRIVPMVGVCALIWLPLRMVMPLLLKAQNEYLMGGSQGDSGLDASVFLMLIFFGATLGQLLANLAAVATVTLFVYGDLVGRPLGVWSAVLGALRHMLRLVGVIVVTVIALMLSAGIVMLLSMVCPILLPLALGFYLVISWRLAVAPSVVVLEGLGVLQAVRRSWDLSQDSFWRWIGIGVLTWVLMFGVGSTLGALDIPQVQSWLASSIGMPEVALGVIIVAMGAVLAGVATAFSAAAQTVYYLDLRMRRDGLDLLMRLDRLSALG